MLKGTFDVKGEWMWSSVEDVTYDPDGSLGFGPTTFDNSRNGAYVQLAYRPAKLESKLLQNLEVVGRYDRLDLPSGAPVATDTDRGTVGLNYWFTPSIVFKTAYQFGTRSDPTEGDTDISNWYVHAAMGF